MYQQIAAKLTTTTTAQTPVTVDGTTMDVQISNNLDPLTKENMMDMTFETTVMSADGTTATGTCKLSDIASWTTGTAPEPVRHRHCRDCPGLQHHGAGPCREKGAGCLCPH